MTAKDIPDRQADADKDPESAPPDLEDKAVDIPEVPNGSPAGTPTEWKPFCPEDGPVDGQKYESLLKAYDDAVERIQDLETRHAALKEESDQCMRNLAGRTDEITRLKKQIDDVRKYGAKDLGRDILNTHDNLKRALAAGRTGETGDITAFVKGIETLFRDFQSTLGRHGVQHVEPQEGDTFDPNLHEAMYQVPSETYRPGQIVSVDQIGFTLHDRLLRPARVGVATAVVPEEPDEA